MLLAKSAPLGLKCSFGHTGTAGRINIPCETFLSGTGVVNEDGVGMQGVSTYQELIGTNQGGFTAEQVSVQHKSCLGWASGSCIGRDGEIAITFAAHAYACL